MAHSERIFVTGLGAVCAAGHTVGQILQALQSGQSAIAPITQWDSTHWPAGMAGEITSIDRRTLVPDRKLHKTIGRTDFFGLYAADTAVAHAGLVPHRGTLSEPDAITYNDRTGIFCGSGGGTYQCNYDFLPLIASAQGELQAFGRDLSSTVTPMWLLRNLPNNVLCHVGIRHGFKGVNGCVTNQCVGGVQAIAEAAACLRSGEADRMVAVGHDAPVEPETVHYYHRVGLLSPDTLSPFDQNANGTILGEGAGALVLETVGSAKTRNAPLLGEFLGAGSTTEGTGILEIREDGDGLIRAIQLALTDSGRTLDDVGMIITHGNGNPKSDRSEVAAIRRVFGENPPPVTAFKWAFGHSLAASGVLDSVLALAALQAGVVPGIGNLKSLHPALVPFPVSHQPQTPRSPIALVLCRGFGGMNVALLFGAAPDHPNQ